MSQFYHLRKKPLRSRATGFITGIGIAVLTALAGGELNAQVSGYVFSQSNGTFNSIAGTGTLVAGSEATTSTTNDTAGWTVNLPFAFNFSGVVHNSIYVNSNGAAIFGANTSMASSVISTATAYDGAIAVMNRDLWGVFITSGVTTSGSNIITNVGSFKGLEIGKQLNNVNGIPAGATVTAFDPTAGTITMSAPATSSSAAAVVRYGTGKIFTSVVGTAPNRTFIIEWNGYNDYGTTVSLSNFMSFQLHLSETTNQVSTVYGDYYNVSTTSKTNQIGLRGSSTSDYFNRSGAVGNAWTNTSAGTTNGATVSRDNTNFPASGLTFSWSVPSCFAPFNFQIPTITTTTAGFTWNASTTSVSNGYTVYYSSTNAAPDSSTVLDATNSVTSTGLGASVTGLTPATTYYVWVRSNCSTSVQSAWLPVQSFVTACVPATSMFENFDSYGTGNIVPTCWVRLAPAASPGSQTITSTTPASGTRNIYQYSTSSTEPVIVVLPEFSNVNAGTNWLRFKARVSTAPGSLDVGYVTDVTNPTSFVVISTLNITNTTYTVAAAEYTVPVPSTVPANARLAIRNAADGKSYYWDDVYWEAMPTCFPVTSIAFAAPTSTSGQVSWTPPATAPANGYTVYYSTVNAAPTSSTVLNSTNSVTTATPSATLSGLSASSTYYVWVRTNCSSTDVSIWEGGTSFNTLCGPVAAPLTQSFSSGSLPNCWISANPTTASTSAAAFWKFTGTADYGAAIANSVKPSGTFAWVDASSPYDNEHTVQLLTPEINLTGLTNPYVQFEWYKNHLTSTGTLPAYDNNKLLVHISTDGTNWTEIFADDTNSSTWRTVGIPLASSYVGATVRIRFTVDKDVAGNGYFYDDVLLDEFAVMQNPNLATGEVIAETRSVKVYPNPFTDLVNISDAKDLQSVSVIDMSGRLVKTITFAGRPVNLGELKSGLYVLKLEYKDGSVKSVKAVKK